MNENEKTWYELHFVEREILKFLFLNSGSVSEVVELSHYSETYILKKLYGLHLKGYVIASREKPVARLTTDGRLLVEQTVGHVR